MNDLYKNRIVGSGVADLNEILFNPRNWRVHPKVQQDALKEVLEGVGWIQNVIVNQRTGNLIDGHLRCQLAAREGAKSIPVVYVDLSEEEEAVALATFDPIGAMALRDTDKFETLVQKVTADDLVGDVLTDISEVADLIDLKEKRGNAQPTVKIDLITPCDYAHSAMTESELGALKKSIQSVGILHPLLVRRIGGGRYEVVDGNQRLRAAKELGLKEVPVTIREMTRQEGIVARLATDEITGKPVASLIVKAVNEIGDDETLRNVAGISKRRLDAYKDSNDFGVNKTEDGFVTRDFKDYQGLEGIDDDCERILMIRLSETDYEFVINKLEAVGKDLGRSLVKILGG